MTDGHGPPALTATGEPPRLLCTPSPATLMHRSKVPLSLPARMSRSSWFVGPSCRDVAMFIPGWSCCFTLTYTVSSGGRGGGGTRAAGDTRRVADTHSRTHTLRRPILARPPTGSRGRPASRRRAEKPHHLTGRAAAAAVAASAGNAILPPRAQTGSPDARPGERPRPRSRRGHLEAGSRPGSRGG